MCCMGNLKNTKLDKNAKIQKSQQIYDLTFLFCHLEHIDPYDDMVIIANNAPYETFSIKKPCEVSTVCGEQMGRWQLNSILRGLFANFWLRQQGHITSPGAYLKGGIGL